MDEEKPKPAAQPVAPGTALATSSKPLAVYGAGQLAAEIGLTEEEMLKDMLLIQDANDMNISDGEIRVSRLMIAQPGTPEVTAKQDGWEAGMLYDTMAREPISYKEKPPWLLDKGIDPAECKATLFTVFLPIFKLPTEYVKWPSKAERDAGVSRYHFKTLDAADPRVREGLWPPKGTWKGKGSPPITETLNILGMCLTKDCQPASSLIIVSFSRTSYPTGTKLVSALASHRLNRMPWWGRVYYLYTDFNPGETGQSGYYTLNFAKGPKILEHAAKFPEADGMGIYRQCFEIAKQLTGENGRELQSRYLSMTDMAEDGDDSEGDASDATSAAATEDPEFA